VSGGIIDTETQRYKVAVSAGELTLIREEDGKQFQYRRVE